MTEDSDTQIPGPSGRVDRLKYSVTNLWDDFGRTDNPLIGAVWNVSMALVGFVVYVYANGLIAFAGAVWAILSLLAIIKWVLGL